MSQPISRISRLLLSLLILFALLFSAWPIPAARAAGIRYAKPAASGAGNCSSWANACTLQTALSGATTGDEIWAGAGVHKPTTGSDRSVSFQLKSGVGIYGGFAMTETLRSQRNPATNVTVLSGDIDNNDLTDPHGVVTNTINITGANAYHVVTAGSGVTTTAALDGFTITGGNANGASPNNWGGGMYNDGGSPRLTNVTFSANTAANEGGGMFNYHNSNPTLMNITFSANSSNSCGGGMYSGANSSPTLMNVTFSGNTAAWGGGGMCNDGGSPTLMNVTFNGNSASSFGGGMYNTNSNLTLTNVTFSGNSTPNNGGGMYNWDSSPTLTNVTFSGNMASYYGGGMCNLGSSPALTNVTFSGNTATGYGGGMYNDASSPMLTNVTFNGNSASSFGGGMYILNGNLTIRNAILWGNTALTGPQVYQEFGAPVISDSVVQGGCPGGSTCTNIITADPLLGALGNYGGETETIPLRLGSSAINAGSDAVCPATDQRGFARPQGAHCDIGAYEIGFSLTKTGGDQQTTPLGMAFAQPLSVTLSENGGSVLPSVTLTFTTPTSGASAALSSLTATTDSSGRASVTATANAILGSYPVTVTTPGVAPITFVLTNTANTLVTVSSSPNPSTFGQTVTFTATVKVVAPGSGTPSGSVAFKADGSVIPGCGAQTLNGSGQATCTTAALAVGPRSVSTEYAGAGIYNPSAAAYPQIVNPARATTTITSSANPSGVDSAVTFTVTVTSPNGIPTGTVELYEVTSPAASLSAQAISARPLVGGVATFTAASLAAGTHTLLALYSGDANFTSSLSAQYVQVVSAQPLVTLTINYAGNGSGTVLRSPDAINYTAGTVVTLTATANPGSTFAGWSGAVVSTTNPLVLTMDAAKAVTAMFVTDQVTYWVFLPIIFRP